MIGDSGGSFSSDGNLGTGSIQMMGILNSMKTGDFFSDMIIVMCLPLLLKIVFAWLSKLEKTVDLQHLYRWLVGKESSPDHERFITQTMMIDSAGRHICLDVNTQNYVLIKAINLYLDQIVKLDLQTAYVDLAESQKKPFINGNTQYALLKGYEISQRIPPGYWYSLGTFGDDFGTVLLKISHVSDGAESADDDGNRRNNGSSAGGKGTKTTTLHFKSKTKGACDAFVTTAYQWYLDELGANEPISSRWYYEMKAKKYSFGSDENEASDTTAFKRYLLSDEKTFANLFFPEKENLLSLIDHFTEKTGKYSIPGYPYKVGILLHGPPG
jgi:chaperone BCS1